MIREMAQKAEWGEDLETAGGGGGGRGLEWGSPFAQVIKGTKIQEPGV